MHVNGLIHKKVVTLQKILKKDCIRLYESNINY